MTTETRRTHTPWRWLVPLLAALPLLAACPTTVPVVDPPVIVSFTADDATIVTGDGTTLRWNVTGADTITIDDGTNDLTIPDGATSLDVTPTATTTYTLTATNDGGEVDATVTVTVTTPTVDPPMIVSFAADDATIVTGDGTTLRWNVTGADTITIDDGTNDLTIPDGATSLDVTPTATTTYTLTATNDGGSVDASTTVTVASAPGAPTITDLAHEIVPGSRALLTWTAAAAVAFEVYAVDAGDDAQPVGAPLGPADREVTIAIPVAARQTVRVCAVATGFADACAETVLENVVTNSDDWDPYSLQGFGPEPEIPGSLRSVILAAEPGSIIGFAADVDEITVTGVDVEDLPALGGWQDAHLILRNDVTISGPAGRVTVRGASGYQTGDLGDPFTYQSRILFVPPGVEAELENLVLTEGTFIYLGAGIRNNGALTVRNAVISENRAWNAGGGIWNTPTGVLELVDSVVSGNRAATEAAEVGTKYEIRGGDPICMYANGFGGGLYNEGTATVRGTLFADNEAVVSGGGIYNVGTLALEDVTFDNNVADYEPYTTDPDFPDYPIFVDDPDCSEVASFVPYSLGGGIYQGTSLTFDGTSLLDNFVRDAGGGLFVDAVSTDAVLSNVLIDFNVAQFGGGIQHEFFDGDDGNLVLGSGVSYGTSSNVPQDYLQNDRGAAPTAIGPTSAVDDAARGRYFATPSMPNR